MQIVFLEDSLHEMSEPVFWENIVLVFSPENRFWHFMQIVSGDNLHEMSKPFFLEK